MYDVWYRANPIMLCSILESFLNSRAVHFRNPVETTKLRSSTGYYNFSLFIMSMNSSYMVSKRTSCFMKDELQLGNLICEVTYDAKIISLCSFSMITIWVKSDHLWGTQLNDALEWCGIVNFIQIILFGHPEDSKEIILLFLCAKNVCACVSYVLLRCFPFSFCPSPTPPPIGQLNL